MFCFVSFRFFFFLKVDLDKILFLQVEELQSSPRPSKLQRVRRIKIILYSCLPLVPSSYSFLLTTSWGTRQVCVLSQRGRHLGPYKALARLFTEHWGQAVSFTKAYPLNIRKQAILSSSWKLRVKNKLILSKYFKIYDTVNNFLLLARRCYGCLNIKTKQIPSKHLIGWVITQSFKWMPSV